jgi:molecular chaperone GrpE
MAKKPTIKELTAALQRERADADNIRRRHEEEIGSLRNLVKASLVRDLLPVIDNFERALKHMPKALAGNDYIKGIQGVVRQFENTLEQIGVQKIKTVGEVFDPKYHEAVHLEDGDGKHEIISEELIPGYKMGDEIIRHAMVKVRMENKK